MSHATVTMVGTVVVDKRSRLYCSPSGEVVPSRESREGNKQRR